MIFKHPTRIIGLLLVVAALDVTDHEFHNWSSLAGLALVWSIVLYVTALALAVYGVSLIVED